MSNIPINEPRKHDHCWVEEICNVPQEFVVHLLWSELEFDIKYGIIKRAKLAGIEGKAAKNYKFTESDEDWMLRAIDKAVHAAKSKLNWACKNAGRFSSDELLKNPIEYNMIFSFKDMKWLGSSNDLMSYIHTYITDSCISEWMEMAGSSSYAILQERANDALQKAWEEVNHVILDNNPKFIL